MATVKVCDKCGTPILSGGSRILHKVAGKETATADLCNGCTKVFVEVMKMYQQATTDAGLTPDPEPTTEVATETSAAPVEEPKGKGK